MQVEVKVVVERNYTTLLIPRMYHDAPPYLPDAPGCTIFPYFEKSFINSLSVGIPTKFENKEIDLIYPLANPSTITIIHLIIFLILHKYQMMMLLPD